MNLSKIRLSYYSTQIKDSQYTGMKNHYLSAFLIFLMVMTPVASTLPNCLNLTHDFAVDQVETIRFIEKTDDIQDKSGRHHFEKPSGYSQQNRTCNDIGSGSIHSYGGGYFYSSFTPVFFSQQNYNPNKHIGIPPDISLIQEFKPPIYAF